MAITVRGHPPVPAACTVSPDHRGHARSPREPSVLVSVAAHCLHPAPALRLPQGVRESLNSEPRSQGVATSLVSCSRNKYRPVARAAELLGTAGAANRAGAAFGPWFTETSGGARGPASPARRWPRLRQTFCTTASRSVPEHTGGAITTVAGGEARPRCCRPWDGLLLVDGRSPLLPVTPELLTLDWRANRAALSLASRKALSTHWRHCGPGSVKPRTSWCACADPCYFQCRPHGARPSSRSSAGSIAHGRFLRCLPPSGLNWLWPVGACARPLNLMAWSPFAPSHMRQAGVRRLHAGGSWW